MTTAASGCSWSRRSAPSAPPRRRPRPARSSTPTPSATASSPAWTSSPSEPTHNALAVFVELRGSSTINSTKSAGRTPSRSVLTRPGVRARGTMEGPPFRPGGEEGGDPMTAPAPDATRPLDEHLLEATTGTLELFGIYLGDRLGLYRALRTAGAVTPDELGATARIAPRYAREWLEQQAVAGVLEVEGTDGDRRFRLPEAHAGILADPTSIDHMAPFSRMLVGIAR